MPVAADQGASSSTNGLLAAVGAYLIWGLSPIYWKALDTVPAYEILMHRMVWSFVFLLPLLIIQHKWSHFTTTLKSPRIMAALAGTAMIVSINWFLFIWAINSGHILETSLGYYINPLLNVVLGMVFLRERLRRAQAVSVILAAIAVGYLTIRYGRFPWVSLALAISFGTYALIRKVAPVGAVVGLAVETMLMSVPAGAYLWHAHATGTGSFLRAGPRIDFLLMGTALLTALPLVLFTTGARRLRLNTIGLLQYIAPSGTFLLAGFVYGEPMAPARVCAFVLIWIALALFSVDAYRHYRTGFLSGEKKPSPAAPASLAPPAAAKQCLRH